jgi:multidrug efflux pump subunit AcrA (membrane-fusion protein)
MLTPDQLLHRLSTAFEPQQAAILAEVVTEAYSELVKTHDFNELKDIVRTLAQAQVRTDLRMEELAQAQSRTEMRMEELAQAQSRTEQRMEELVQAQTRTEAAIQTLVKDNKSIRKELGGLSTTVGYQLENEAYKALPGLLLRDYNIRLEGDLKRGYVTDNQGRALEINILGDAIQDMQPIKIIGESKSQLSVPKINRFIERQLNAVLGVFPQIFPILVTHMGSSPEVEGYAKEKGIALYYSYDFNKA